MEKNFGCLFYLKKATKNQIESSVPVLFDFYGSNLPINPDEYQHIYCLLPKTLRDARIVAEIPHEAFIKSVHTGDWTVRVKNFIDFIIEVEKGELTKISDITKLQDNINFQRNQRRRLRF